MSLVCVVMQKKKLTNSKSQTLSAHTWMMKIVKKEKKIDESSHKTRIGSKSIFTSKNNPKRVDGMRCPELLLASTVKVTVGFVCVYAGGMWFDAYDNTKTKQSTLQQQFAIHDHPPTQINNLFSHEFFIINKQLTNYRTKGTTRITSTTVGVEQTNSFNCCSTVLEFPLWYIHISCILHHLHGLSKKQKTKKPKNFSSYTTHSQENIYRNCFWKKGRSVTFAIMAI